MTETMLWEVQSQVLFSLHSKWTKKTEGLLRPLNFCYVELYTSNNWNQTRGRVRKAQTLADTF